MYARGMSVREIQGHLLELYGLQVSPDLISTVTDEVLAEVEQWQQRPLEAMYPIVYFDALRLKIRDEGTVKNKAGQFVDVLGGDFEHEPRGRFREQQRGVVRGVAVARDTAQGDPGAEPARQGHLGDLALFVGHLLQHVDQRGDEVAVLAVALHRRIDLPVIDGRDGVGDDEIS